MTNKNKSTFLNRIVSSNSSHNMKVTWLTTKFLNLFDENNYQKYYFFLRKNLHLFTYVMFNLAYIQLIYTGIMEEMKNHLIFICFAAFFHILLLLLLNKIQYFIFKNFIYYIKFIFLMISYGFFLFFLILMNKEESKIQRNLNIMIILKSILLIIFLHKNFFFNIFLFLINLISIIATMIFLNSKAYFFEIIVEIVLSLSIYIYIRYSDINNRNTFSEIIHLQNEVDIEEESQNILGIYLFRLSSEEEILYINKNLKKLIKKFYDENENNDIIIKKFTTINSSEVMLYNNKAVRNTTSNLRKILKEKSFDKEKIEKNDSMLFLNDKSNRAIKNADFEIPYNKCRNSTTYDIISLQKRNCQKKSLNYIKKKKIPEDAIEIPEKNLYLEKDNFITNIYKPAITYDMNINSRELLYSQNLFRGEDLVSNQEKEKLIFLLNRLKENERKNESIEGKRNLKDIIMEIMSSKINVENKSQFINTNNYVFSNSTEDDIKFKFLGIFSVDRTNKAINFEVFYRKKISQNFLEFYFKEKTEEEEEKNERINQSLFNLKSENEQKIFAKIAHEFKTPLNSIIGLISEMKLSSKETFDLSRNLNDSNSNSSDLNDIDAGNYKKIKKNLVLIHNLSHYTIYLINDLMQYVQINLKKSSSDNIDKSAKIPENQISINKTYIKLDRIINFSYDILRSLISCNDKKAQFVRPLLFFDEDLKYIQIYTDEIRLNQILLNLISNSVKFTKSGFIKIIAERTIYNGIKLSVEDDGIGIKEEEQSNIFNKNPGNIFNTNIHYEVNKFGSGLGLSIVLSLVEALGFEVSFKSTYGHGSRFDLFIGKEFVKESSKNLKIYDIKEEKIRKNMNQLINGYSRNNLKENNEIKYLESKAISNLNISKTNYNSNSNIRTSGINLVYKSEKNIDQIEKGKFKLGQTSSLTRSNTASFNSSLQNLIFKNFKKNVKLEKTKSFSEGKAKVLSGIISKLDIFTKGLNKSIDSNIETYKYVLPFIKPNNVIEEFFEMENSCEKIKIKSSNETSENYNNLIINNKNSNNIILFLNDPTFSEKQFNKTITDKQFSKQIKNFPNFSNCNYETEENKNQKDFAEKVKHMSKIEDSENNNQTKIYDKIPNMKYLWSQKHQTFIEANESKADYFNIRSLAESSKESNFNSSKKKSKLNISRTKSSFKKSSQNFYSSSIDKDNAMPFRSKADNVFLIVDDNKYIRKSILNMIKKTMENIPKKHSYEIVEGSDGVDILKYLIDDQIDNRIKCVFTDENMEYINGSEAISILRGLQDKNKIRGCFIVSVTSFEDEFTKGKIKKLGADMIVSKPISNYDIVQIFRKLILNDCLI